MIRRYLPMLTVLAFALMALPAAAAAQDESHGPSFELFGGAGALYSSSSSLSLQTETVGTRGGFSLTRVWTVEAALSRTSGDPVTWNGEISAKAYLFQNERVRLFALAGPGIRHEDTHAHTHSILMRAKHQTIRYIKTVHNLDLKTVRLRSDAQDHSL